MSILLPIISNIILIAIMAFITILGVKHGVKATLLELAFIAIAAVSGYFIAYAITPSIASLLSVSSQVLTYTVFSFIILFAFMIVYLILELIKEIILIVVLHKKGIFNTAKSTKLKGIDKSATKELRRQEKELEKLNRPKRSVASRVFGGIFAFIASIIVTCVVMLPVKYSCDLIATANEDKAYVTSTYEYTAQGQIDNLLSGIIEIDSSIEGE